MLQLSDKHARSFLDHRHVTLLLDLKPNLSVHRELGGSSEGCDLQQVEGAFSHCHQDSGAHAGKGRF